MKTDSAYSVVLLVGHWILFPLMIKHYDHLAPNMMMK